MDINDNLGIRFSEGGEAELEELMALYAKRLFQYCFNTVCDYHAAEDITQQVFIKAYHSRRKFRADASLSTWLYRIAYNCCIDYLRRERFHLSLFEAKEISYIQEDRMDRGFSPEVLQALFNLTPKERAVVYGRIVEEKSYRELAEISNVSESTLRKRYMRAKNKLEKALRFALL